MGKTKLMFAFKAFLLEDHLLPLYNPAMWAVVKTNLFFTSALMENSLKENEEGFSGSLSLKKLLNILMFY